MGEVCGVVPKTTLLGIRVQLSPPGVAAETESATVPVNPLRVVSVIVEVPIEPANI